MHRVPAVVLWVVLVLVVLVVVEGVATFATRILVKRGAMAEVPRLGEGEIALAVARRSALLGWGPETDADGKVRRLAPRFDPAFPEGRAACVSVYGDSFTLGASDDVTYPHRAAVAIGCPVAN
jgi:hypothetical protein